MASIKLNNYSQRFILNNEVHARPYQLMSSPMRVSHIALLSNDHEQEIKAISSLCDHFGVTRPNSDSNFFIADFPLFQMRWERHTEFSTYTLAEPVNSDQPFAESALSKLPENWLAELPGEVLTSLNLELVRNLDEELTLVDLHKLFSSNTVAGSVVSSGAAIVWTDFNIHGDGFNRVLIEDKDLRQRQAGRLVQRILEIETYRMLALLSLPLARKFSLELSRSDTELARLTQQVSGLWKIEEEQKLLEELSRIAANVEHIAANTGYRFSATNAYYGLVNRRITELREQRIDGVQTFQEFMERRLTPAVRTCESVSERVNSLSNRISRVSDLLRTRININLEAQNRDLLHSMDKRAAVQLRLQEMVEGLSVVVLSYYGVGLIGYMLKGLKQLNINVNTDLAIGISVPLVALTVYMGLRLTRRRLDARLKDDDASK